jgi:hypothetical protein
LCGFAEDLDFEATEPILADQLAQLPFGRHFGGDALERHRVDDQPEDALVQAFRQ